MAKENIFDFSNVDLFSWDDLFYFKLETEIGIDSFRTLIKNQEVSLEETKAKFKELLKNDQEFNSLPDRDQGSYYYAIYESEERAIHELQLQQRYSICLSLFSFFEGRLKNICNIIDSEYHFKIKIKDLRKKDDDISTYINYFEKVFEMDIETVSNLSKPIVKQKILRNAIAHNGGVLTEQNEKIALTQAGIRVVKIGNELQLQIINIDFFANLLENMETFFKELLVSMDKRYTKGPFVTKEIEPENGEFDPNTPPF